MEAAGDSSSRNIRRAASWILTAAALGVGALAHRLLPGADGLAGEIRWILTHPAQGRIDHALLLLTLLDLGERGASGRIMAELFDTTPPQAMPRLLELVWIGSAPGARTAWENFVSPVSRWLMRTPVEEWEQHAAQLARIWNAFSQIRVPSQEWEELAGYAAQELMARRLDPRWLIRCSQSPDVYETRGALLMLLAAESHAARQECLRRMRDLGIEIGRTATFQEGVTLEFPTLSANTSVTLPLALRIADVLRTLLMDSDPTIRCQAALILTAGGDLQAWGVLGECATLKSRIGEAAHRVFLSLRPAE